MDWRRAILEAAILVLARVVPTLVDAIAALVRDWLRAEIADDDDLPQIIRQIVIGVNRDGQGLSDDELWDRSVAAVDAHLERTGKIIGDSLRNRLIELALGEAQEPQEPAP